MEHEELSGKIIGVFYRVYNCLGYGFLEKVYENALKIEFEKIGLSFENQVPVKVYYSGEIVGDYFADFIIEGKIIVEVKSTIGLCGIDDAQLLNYLKATDKNVGLLLNFGKRVEIKRMVF